MDELLIPSVDGRGALLFYDRTPADPANEIGDFWVRVTDHGLSATAKVYAGYMPSHPAPLFAEMASKWKGWQNELVWESLEHDMTLRCRHDGLGHIAIRTELRSGHMCEDWKVTATVIIEAGQLERITKRAAMFFGSPDCS